MNKLFNNETCPGRSHSKGPAIHLNVTGLVFNQPAVEDMNIKKGDRFSFEQVGERFFVFRDDKNGIPVTSMKNKGMQISRKSLLTSLQKAVGKARFRMQPQKQTEYRWELILLN